MEQDNRGNLLLKTDSYKATHWKQYPKGTSEVYSYLESRGGLFPETTFFGLQYILKRHLEGQVVTREKIDKAERFWRAHFGQELFNRAGWEHILKKHGGRLPIEIASVPEGVTVPVSNVLMSIRNTDPECFWLPNYLETLLLQIWYPITVCTLSNHIKRRILASLNRTGNPELTRFKLHDFGYRGVSSCESAGIGGAAHLVNFMGTDTVAAIELAMDYYGADMCGFSIPASEHSTITSWGRAHEADAMRNMLEQYPSGLVACVSDSFDIYNACSEIWGGLLKDQVLAREGTLVVRPDSGDPTVVPIQCLELLGQKFGYETNAKGFKVLPPQIRVIQGDGINHDSIGKIIENLEAAGWSLDNLAFGMGGALLQQMNRDTQKFAIKCSSVVVNGERRDVFKAPVSDMGKQSKRGMLMLNDAMETVVCGKPEYSSLFRPVFQNGEMLVEDDFDSIRARAAM